MQRREHKSLPLRGNGGDTEVRCTNMIATYNLMEGVDPQMERFGGLVAIFFSFRVGQGSGVWYLITGKPTFGPSLFPNHSALVDRGCHQRATDWPVGMSFSCIHFNAMFIQVCLNMCENDAPKPNLSFRWLQLYQSYANQSTIIY